LLFSAVIFEHFSKNRMIISVLAAKTWYLKKCTVFIGPPCRLMPLMKRMFLLHPNFVLCSNIISQVVIVPNLRIYVTY